MTYQIYQTRDDLLHPLREAARFGAAWVRAWDLGCLTPPLFRALGAAVNQSPFYAAFSVKPGDKMYLPPEQRVVIW